MCLFRFVFIPSVFWTFESAPTQGDKTHWTVDGLARSPLQHFTARKDYTLVAIFHLLNENTKNPTNNLLSAESDTQTFQAFKRHNDRLLATSPTRRETRQSETLVAGPARNN